VGWAVSLALRWCSTAARKTDNLLMAEFEITVILLNSIRLVRQFGDDSSVFSGHDQSPGEALKNRWENVQRILLEVLLSFKKGNIKMFEGKKIMVAPKGDISNTLLEMKQDFYNLLFLMQAVRDIEALR